MAVNTQVLAIILGGGLRLFADAETVPLELTRARPFQSGNVLLYYRPKA